MPNRREVAILFDGSYEGFLCIVHAHYYDGITPLIIQENVNYQPTLDTEEYHILTDNEKAARVQQAIRKKISGNAVHQMTYSYLSEHDDKYMVMFRYLVLGFKVGSSVDSHLDEDYVRRVHQLTRQVGREGHLLTGFSRFEETANGIFYCSILPKNYVLPILAEHFSDRMMNQAWIIHDKNRGKAAIYNGEEYVITDVPKTVEIQHSESEAHIQNLWTTFFHSVNIKERVNPKVQRNLLPLYFRKSMTEFKIKT